MAVSIVDSVTSVVSLLDNLENLPIQPPSLYLDLEGANLSRHGSISIIQIFVLPKKHTFLVDIHVLQGKAFNTPNSSGTSLKSILESSLVPKVFFDVRNDADALFAHYQISMQGVRDLQLMEVARRSQSKERVAGLAQCIRRDVPLAADVKDNWKATKQRTLVLFAPEHGGSYEVFNIRPIRPDIIDYCTKDVQYLPFLWNLYSQKLSKKWAGPVRKETLRRVRMSQDGLYEPHGRDKILSPWAKSVQRSVSAKLKSERRSVREHAKNKKLSIAEVAAPKAPQKKKLSQSGAKMAHEKPAKKTSFHNAPIRNKSLCDQKIPAQPASTLDPTSHLSKWTYQIFSREMQIYQKQVHLTGRQHNARGAPYPASWSFVGLGGSSFSQNPRFGRGPYMLRVVRALNIRIWR